MSAPDGRGRNAARRRCRRAALAVIAVVSVACSVPSEQTARPIESGRLVTEATVKPNCSIAQLGEQAKPVPVYLVSRQDERAFVLPIERLTTGEPDPKSALAALFDCRVTDDDRSRGLTTAIPDRTLMLDLVPLAEGDYEVQMGPLLDQDQRSVDDLARLAVAQMLFTVNDPAVTDRPLRLRFVIDGQPVSVNTDTRTVPSGGFVSMDDFTSSAPSTR